MTGGTATDEGGSAARRRWAYVLLLTAPAMFAGNQIVFMDTARQESALTGGDFQIGFPVLGNPWLKTWLGAGVPRLLAA